MRGRPRSSTRLLVEDCIVLDVARVPIEQMKAARDGDPWEKFMHRTGGLLHGICVTATRSDGRQFSQNIEFRVTNPNYGGERYWFSCPSCQGRAAKLCATSESTAYACRRCLRLVYNCQYRKGWIWKLLHESEESVGSAPQMYTFEKRSEIDLEKSLLAGPPRAGASISANPFAQR